MTVYTSFSPVKRADHGPHWANARDQLVSDAIHLSRVQRPGFTTADQLQFGDIAHQIRAWTESDACDTTVFDAWGNPRRFLIVAQEEFAL